MPHHPWPGPGAGAAFRQVRCRNWSRSQRSAIGPARSPAKRWSLRRIRLVTSHLLAWRPVRSQPQSGARGCCDVPRRPWASGASQLHAATGATEPVHRSDRRASFARRSAGRFAQWPPPPPCVRLERGEPRRPDARREIGAREGRAKATPLRGAPRRPPPPPEAPAPERRRIGWAVMDRFGSKPAISRDGTGPPSSRSISRNKGASSIQTSETAVPRIPARPVRPMRCR
jgi:hypothetical protein